MNAATEIIAFHSNVAVVLYVERLVMTRTHKNWSKEDDLILQQSIKNGLTYKQISTLLSRTISSISNRCKKYNISTNRSVRWSPKDDEDLKDYLNQELSHREISFKLNRTIQAVSYRCLVLKLTKNKFWTLEEDELIINYTNAGLTQKEIGVLLNRTTKMIQYRCRCLKTTSQNEGKTLCVKCGYKNISSTPMCINCGHKFRECKSLAENNPELLKEWNYKRNIINPNCVTFRSNISVWWVDKLGHEWKMPITRRTGKNRKDGCPYCTGHQTLKGFNDIWTTHPEICEELVNKEDGYKVRRGSEKKLKWKCKDCNNIWETTSLTRTNGSGCPRCFKSKGEKRVLECLDNLYIKSIPQYKNTLCKDKNCLPFDFYLPDYNICIEYQGQFHSEPHWSSNGKKSLKTTIKHDKIKKEFCEKNNIELIEIFYWEFDNIEQIINGIL
jgi:hypothetical protein